MIQWRVVCNHSLTSISTNFSQSDLRLQEHLLTETCYYTRTMIGSNSLSKQIRGSWALMTSAEVVKLGNNCFVWVPHNQNASSSKLLIDQGSWVVVCLLYNSWAIFPTSYLAPESSHEELEVFVHRTCENISVNTQKVTELIYSSPVNTPVAPSIRYLIHVLPLPG